MILADDTAPLHHNKLLPAPSMHWRDITCSTCRCQERKSPDLCLSLMEGRFPRKKTTDLSTAAFRTVNTFAVLPVANISQPRDVFCSCLHIEHPVTYGGTISAVEECKTIWWQLQEQPRYGGYQGENRSSDTCLVIQIALAIIRSAPDSGYTNKLLQCLDTNLAACNSASISIVLTIITFKLQIPG